MKRTILALIGSLVMIAAYAVTISDSTREQIVQVGLGLGVPRSITLGLIKEESGGDPEEISTMTSAGFRSFGLFQLYTEPKNFKMLLDNFWPGDPAAFNIWDPVQNATVGLGYIAYLHQLHGTWFRATKAYNSGYPDSTDPGVVAYALRVINHP